MSSVVFNKLFLATWASGVVGGAGQSSYSRNVLLMFYSNDSCVFQFTILHIFLFLILKVSFVSYMILTICHTNTEINVSCSLPPWFWSAVTFPVVPAVGWESEEQWWVRKEDGGMVSVAPPPDSLPPFCEHEAVRSANVAGERAAELRCHVCLLANN